MTSLALGRKLSIVFVPILILSAIFSAVSAYSLESDQKTLKEVQVYVAPKTVHSGQVSLLLLKLSLSEKTFPKDLHVKISIKYKVYLGSAPPTSLSTPFLEVPALPFPLSPNWYVVSIPGIPSLNLSLSAPPFKIKILPRVCYEVFYGQREIAYGSYQILPSQGSPLPPILWTLPEECLQGNSASVNETLGLGPPGWVCPSNSKERVLVATINPSKVSNVCLIYSISGGAWKKAYLTRSSLIQPYEVLLNSTEELLHKISSLPINFPLKVPKISPPVSIFEAEIPQVSPGNYVEYKAVAKGSNNREITSPLGLYFISDSNSKTKILIVDPEIRLWVLQESSGEFSSMATNFSTYSLPENITSSIQKISCLSRKLSEYNLIQFHHWEMLGESHQIYIVSPGQTMAKILEGSFQRFSDPSVIYLSNLWLGLKSFKNFLNWDLKNIKIGGVSLLYLLTSYLRSHHAGLLASEGSLCDLLIWLSSKKEIKIGAVDDIGRSLSDLLPGEPHTLAELLGMSQLTLLEVVKDLLAESLSQSAQTQAAGTLIGSLALQIPYLPFDGTLIPTKEASELGWKLPKEINIEMEGIGGGKGIRSYTEVGWQLCFPSAIADLLFKGLKGTPSQNFLNLPSFISSLSGIKESSIKKAFSGSINWGMPSFYSLLSRSHINNLNVSLFPGSEIPVLKNLHIQKGITLDLKEYLSFLFQIFSTKVVAISKDGRAGIIAYDDWWEKEGYRAVYFSFEVEAMKGGAAKTLLQQAISWTLRWKYRGAPTLFDRMAQVFSNSAKILKEEMERGTLLSKGFTLLSSQGSTELNLSGSPGEIKVLILAPNAADLSVKAIGRAKVVQSKALERSLEEILVKCQDHGRFSLLLRGDPPSYPLSPAYFSEVLVRIPSTPTPTPSPRKTPTVTPKVTPTPRPTTSPVVSTKPSSGTGAGGGGVVVSSTPSPVPAPSKGRSKGGQKAGGIFWIGIVIAIGIGLAALIRRRRGRRGRTKLVRGPGFEPGNPFGTGS